MNKRQRKKAERKKERVAMRNIGAMVVILEMVTGRSVFSAPKAAR